MTVTLDSSTAPSAVATVQDWTRFGWDAGRSNANMSSTGITAANVAGMVRQQVTIDGTVDASPIYLHGATIRGGKHDAFLVTTTYGKTLAIDADSGKVLWEFTPAGYSGWSGSHQVTTATPVADPSRRFIYAASPDGHIQKLSVADGSVQWSTAITTLPALEKIASALNYYNGNIVAVTGGYIGDAPPYQGHVAILDAATGKLLHVWNSLCSDRATLLDPKTCPEAQSAIWGRAGAVIDTATGNILVATGNGKWDGKTNWGDATIELNASASAMLGNYTPSNTDQLNATDADVGSSSPALLGGGYVAQGGKDGTIRLLNASVLNGAAPHKGGELQVIQTPGSARLFTAPAVLRSGSNTVMFVADGSGTAAWSFTGGKLQPVWQNSTPGTSPVYSGGLLFVYNPKGGLLVYQPGNGQQVAKLDAGGGHWNTPIIVDGRIALPEGNSNSHSTSGTLDIWRLH
ncbi:MAG: PQQ-binding-like beta-propeller repeat protein [Gemmatimonadota bacterium]|nr:PQQ-binding-like beta-propeller repeat protein [Gemmatimonadota bacterium]